MLDNAVSGAYDGRGTAGWWCSDDGTADTDEAAGCWETACGKQYTV